MKKLAVVLMVLGLTACIEYSDGDRVGTIFKFSKKGFFCKTWEGTLNLSINGQNAQNMQLERWDFTVEKEELVQQIQDALAHGKKVKMTYTQEVATFCRSDSNYFVKAVTVVE